MEARGRKVGSINIYPRRQDLGRQARRHGTWRRAQPRGLWRRGIKPCRQPRQSWGHAGSKLGAMAYGAETLNLGTMGCGADPRV